MQNLSIALRHLQPAAEGAAPHLVDHVEKSSQALWQQMKDILGKELEVVLEKINWPSKDASLLGDRLREWEDAVGKLLELQEP
jgi:hypothetical protein